ncbi:MAG TPA: hypothetical protein VLH77_07215 [Gammaproteobacteria bacterium]|nr:hypothetical protein [Gammaproteobacteria bacterium]
MHPIVRKALEETYYGRAIVNIDDSDEEGKPRSLVFSAIMGFQTKYRYDLDRELPVSEFYSTSDSDSISHTKLIKDRNIYNWAEQVIFFPFRLIKNLLKLGTEFIWNLAAGYLDKKSEEAFKKAAGRTKDSSSASHAYGAGVSYAQASGPDIFDQSSHIQNGHMYNAASFKRPVKRPNHNSVFKRNGFYILGILAKGTSYLCWMIAKLGQSITSPFAAMKESYIYFSGKTGFKTLGIIAAALRGSVTVSAYALIAIVAAPPLLVGSLATAANWLSSLPVISNIGAGLASFGSTLGLSSAAAATLASATVALTPVLAGLKVLVRWLSPFKNQEYFPDDDSDDGFESRYQSARPQSELSSSTTILSSLCASLSSCCDRLSSCIQRKAPRSQAEDSLPYGQDNTRQYTDEPVQAYGRQGTRTSATGSFNNTTDGGSSWAESSWAESSLYRETRTGRDLSKRSGGYGYGWRDPHKGSTRGEYGAAVDSWQPPRPGRWKHGPA